MEYRYSMYGVSVRSDMPFDFPPYDAAADTLAEVSFARGADDAFACAPAKATSDGWFVYRELEDRSLYLRWSDWYECRVSADGSTVFYRALHDGDPAILQNFLFGQALSFALIRQHLEPLHASVVDVGGHAIALLGDCTYGKSTFAASLLRAGCRLVSDDLLLVRLAQGRVMAPAGAGRIKLYPDSARAFLGDTRDGAPVIPNAEKRVFQLGPTMVRRADVPLRAFVVLPTPDERAASARVELRRMNRTELFHELVKNTFVRHVEDGARLRRNFSSNSYLASVVDGYRLRYPPGIDRLAHVGRAMLDTFATGSQGDIQ